MTRRKKILVFGRDTGISKWEMLAFLRKLPEDAYVARVDYDVTRQESVMVIASETFPEVADGEMYPYLDLYITRHDLYAEVQGMVSQKVGCICDMAYTGVREHKRECPAR